MTDDERNPKHEHARLDGVLRLFHRLKLGFANVSQAPIDADIVVLKAAGCTVARIAKRCWSFAQASGVRFLTCQLVVEGNRAVRHRGRRSHCASHRHQRRVAAAAVLPRHCAIAVRVRRMRAPMQIKAILLFGGYIINHGGRLGFR